MFSRYGGEVGWVLFFCLSKEGGTGAAGDSHFDVLADVVVTFVEDDHFVLLGPPAKLFATAFAGAFYQDFTQPSFFATVGLGRVLVLNLNEFVQSANLHLFGNIVGKMLGGVGSGAFAVFKHEGRVVAYGAHDVEGELVVGLFFAVVAHEDVGRDTAVGHDFSNGTNATEVPFYGVFAVHEPEHFVRPALDGQVDVTADIRFLSDDVESFVAHVFGMRRGEADAHGGNGSSNGAEKLGEVDCGVTVLESIAIHVLPK